MENKKATAGDNILEILNTCRICMAQDLKMSPIFENGCNISEQILYCTGLQLNKKDGLPSQICIKCLEDLTIAHKFKTTCILANDTFERLLKSGIKVEFNVDVAVHVDSNNWDEDDDISSIKEEVLDVQVPVSVARKSKTIQKDKKKRGPYKKPGKPKLKKFKFKKLWCEPCTLRFPNKSQLETHRKDIHANSEPESWVCEICGKVFLHRGSLSTHIRSHLPPEFGCDQCDYKTWNKYDLTKHIRIHKGEKIYQCQYCTEAYYTSSNLNSHIRRSHVGEKKYACDMCEKRFFDKTKFNRHIDSHNNVKRYECEVCHSCFTRRCYWKKHLHRQHNIIIPPQRPGKQKVNLLVGQLDSTEVL